MIKNTNDFLYELNKINKSEILPLYIVNSDQSYVIENFVETFKSLVPYDTKSFNQFIFYEHDSTIEDILTKANNYPLNGDLQIIIVRTANKIIGKIEIFNNYLEKFSKHCTILMCVNGKKINKKNPILKKVIDYGGLIETKKIYENDLSDWIIYIAKLKSLNLDYELIELIKQRTGSNLSKISNEISKISLMGSKNHTTKNLIYKYFGVNNQYNIFELQKSLGKKNFDKAFLISKYFSENSSKYPPQLIFTSLHNYYLNIFQIKCGVDLGYSELAKITGIYQEFILNDLKRVSTKFSLKEIVKILSIIKKYDSRSKGLVNKKFYDSEILQFISEIKI